MNAYRLAAIAALSIAVASCGSSKTANKDADSVTPSGAATMADAAPDAQLKEGKGTGTVTAIDTAGGKITLDHDPIPELGWPAMKMAFKAAPAVTGSTAVGDTVEFDVRTTGMDSEITALRKQ